MITVHFMRCKLLLVRVGVKRIAKGFILGYYDRTKVVHN
jgi:hypothetical protein